MKKQEETILAAPHKKEKFTPQYRKLFVGLSLLHAVIEKQNIFGSKVWTVPFELNEGIIEIAAGILRHSLNFFNDPPQGAGGAQNKILEFPWPELQRFFGDICLGGHLMEISDSNILVPLAAMYINEDIGKGNFNIKDTAIYKLTNRETFEDLLNEVGALPNIEDYNLCGMSPEVTLEGKYNELEAELKNLKELEVEKYKDNKEDKFVESRVLEMINKIKEELLELLFANFEINPKVSELNNGVLYGNNLYLLQELERYKVLKLNIMDTINLIEMHLKSGLIMPSSLEKAYFEIDSGIVPEMLIGYCWNHPLAEWVSKFKENIEYISNWAKQGEVNCYNIRALLYPKGIFNALIITFSQFLKQPIEVLTLNLQPTSFSNPSDLPENNPETAYIYGLYIVNGKFNIENEALEDFTDDELSYFKDGLRFSRMTVISIIPTDEQKDIADEYKCPIYYLPKTIKTIGTLENYLGNIDLLSYIGYPYWTMKNVYMTFINPETNI